MPKKREQWEIDLDVREDALKTFKRNFRKSDPLFAANVKQLCNHRDVEDEPYVQKVATLLSEDKKLFTSRLEYLAVMTSETNLGRSKRYKQATMDEGGNKLRAVLGIVLGT